MKNFESSNGRNHEADDENCESSDSDDTLVLKSKTKVRRGNSDGGKGDARKGGSGRSPKKDFFGKDFELMSVMNRLYDVLRDVKSEGYTEISLPTLVVVGDQSHGKTSVLEGIMKKELLPKGDQIQTRCPIELQLRHIFDGRHDSFEVLNEDGQTSQVLRTTEEVRRVIQERTDRIKEQNPVGVSHERIVVKIFSKDVPDLTLVDLPGLLSVNMENQDAKIVEDIRKVVRHEISNPNSIILAVTAAGSNIGTSRALEEANKVDPERKRTVGVITKLDLMDKGTRCDSALRNKDYFLHHGFVGVVNRSFDDNSRGKSIEEKEQEEREFLEEFYSEIAYSNGVPYLTRRISRLLLDHIYTSLPNVMVSVQRLIHRNEDRYAQLGVALDPGDRRRLLVGYLEKFRDALRSQIDGSRRDIPSDQLNASAKIQMVYRDLLRTPNFQLMENVSDSKILTVIKNAHALHNMMDMSVEDAFHHFAKDEISKLRPHVLCCVEAVNARIIDAINASCDPAAKIYPKLNNSITVEATTVVNNCFQKCKSYLLMYLESEEAMIYSADEDLKRKLQHPRSTVQEATGEKGTEAVAFNLNQALNVTVDEVKMVRLMVANYFDIVVDRVKDHCPKAITKHLVYSVMNQMGNALMLQLDNTERLHILMEESYFVIKDRAEVIEKLEKYKKAKQIIDEVMNTAPMSL